MKTVVVTDSTSKKHTFYKRDADVVDFVERNLWEATWGEPEEVSHVISSFANEQIKAMRRLTITDAKTKVTLKTLVVKDIVKAVSDIVESELYGELGIDYTIAVTKLTAADTIGIKR